MKIKTADLIGPALDWAVAKCLQPGYEEWRLIRWIEQEFAPTANWAQGGPIIEREWLDLTSWPNESDEEQRWQCHQYDAPKPYQALGPTPLVAAMRCLVASRLGDEVDVPDELV